ncbi:hypothetical protein ACFLS0_07425 [Candidatus Bipolaricaulota bacterium]
MEARNASAVVGQSPAGSRLCGLTLAVQTIDRIALMHQERSIVTGPPSDVLTRRHIKQAFDLDVVVGSDPGTSLTYVLPSIPNPNYEMP